MPQFLKLILLCCFSVLSCTKTATQAESSPNPPGVPTNLTVKVSTIAGKLNDHGNAEDGIGSNARFWNPGKMVYDNRNNMLYIADGSVIRSLDAANNVNTYVPLNALGSSFNEILDMTPAPGAGGTLYVTTKENDLWKIEPGATTGVATNIVNRVSSGNATGVLNSGDHFDKASGLACGSNGEIYFFNQSWNTMHRITLYSNNTGIVDTFAGKPLSRPGGDGTPYPFADGKGESATFSGRVQDIASDGEGNIYVADLDNNIVRKVAPDGTVSSLFPFKSKVGKDLDGPVASATSNSVTQVTTTDDGKSTFFISYGNAGNNLSALRLVRPGKDITTLVGYGYSAAYGDGNGQTAGLAEVGGVATTPDGKTIYLAEPGTKVIRKVTIQ